MDYTFQVKIRQSHLVRRILLPIIYSARFFQYKSYLRRRSGNLIRKYKGIHENERCFIIGNGPSLSAKDLSLIENEKSFAFNSIYHIYNKTSWRPTYYMLTDKALISTFMKEPIPDLEVNGSFVFSKKLSQYWKLKNNTIEIFLKGKVPVHRESYFNTTISSDVSKFFTASQSVIINAFELAFYMGFKEICIIGVDHDFPVEVDMKGEKTLKDTKSHFEENKDKCNFLTYKDALTKCYETCKDYADKNGIKIWNSTRGGKLEVFERRSLEDVLNKSIHEEKL